MQSALRSTDNSINLGMAGTAFRFLTAGFSIISGRRIINGHDRLKERPIGPLVDALRELGASINYLEKEGFLPLEIEGGKIEGDYIEIDQKQSSQFVSALMMIGPFLPNGLRIKRRSDLRSEPYVKLTNCVMNDLGYSVQIDGEEIRIKKSNSKVDSYSIESDWSAASYWFGFVALLPNANVTLKGLKKNSCQGDKVMLDILSQFNLSYRWNNEDLHLSNTNLNAYPKVFKYDCSDIPDQAQTLAFLCAALGVEMELSGLETLKYKETNRIEALQVELNKLGLTIQTTDSTLKMSGVINVDSVQISTYNDHRMAMAASLLGTRIDTVIENPNVVSKSYPRFWDDLKRLTT